MNKVSALITLSYWSTTSRSTTFKYTSNFAWSLPPKCITKLAQSWCRVYLLTWGISASMCSSMLTWLRLASLFPHLLDCRLPSICNLAWSLPHRASLCRLNHSLYVHTQTWSSVASQCFSELAWLLPQSVSPHVLKYVCKMSISQEATYISPRHSSWPHQCF